MTTINPGLGRLLAGLGGALLVASLFAPWTGTDGTTHDGWQALGVWDVFLAITGACGIAAGVTGGRFGFFRPDLSFNGMTDIFGVVAGTLITWFVLADFPTGATREVGVYLALAGAVAVATGAGDFCVKSLFPEVPSGDRRAVPSGEIRK